MRTDIEISRKQIRQALRESVGWGRDYSLKQASEATGIGSGTLYQIADGTMKFPEKHLLALLDLPAFADRFMTLRGHACSFIGNHDGCAFESIGSVLQAAGVSAKVVADRKITDPEKKQLADAYHHMIAKCQAFLHRFKRDQRERLTARAGV